MNLITMICPELHVRDANNLTMALGTGPADGLTFDALGWQDADGARYSVASWDASQEWLGPLVRPGWDAEPYQVNMAAAGRAQARVLVHEPSEDKALLIPQAIVSAILMIAGPEPEACALAAGLVKIAPDDGV